MAEELRAALREVRDKLLSNPVSPRVETPRDINLRYCRYVAMTVADAVGDQCDFEILEDGGRGFVHTWISHEGRHYDAECLDGVADYRDLPFFERHPEAAVHVVPASTNPAKIRDRGRRPLYPATLGTRRSPDTKPFTSTRYRKLALVGVVFGLGLILIGAVGRLAIHDHVVQPMPVLSVLFQDLEMLGELVALVAPLLFFVLLPAHGRPDRR